MVGKVFVSALVCWHWPWVKVHLISVLESQVDQVILNVAMCINKVRIIVARCLECKVEHHARIRPQKRAFLAELDRLLGYLVEGVSEVCHHVETFSSIGQSHYQN